MKIVTNKAVFQPVSLTLETQEELDNFAGLIYFAFMQADPDSDKEKLAEKSYDLLKPFTSNA